MTREEFTEWFAYHNARFTGVASWLGKFPMAARREGDPTQAMIVDAWFGTLRNVQLADAKRATDALHCGDEQFTDKGYDCHPMSVRRAALGVSNERRADNTARRYFGGEPTYRCHHCLDGGTRRIVHPKTIAAAREFIEIGEGEERQTIPKLYHPRHNPSGSYPVYSAEVACRCEAGDRWADFLGCRFDDKANLEWQHVGEQWDQVFEFANANRMSRYETDLSGYEYPQEEDF